MIKIVITLFLFFISSSVFSNTYSALENKNVVKFIKEFSNKTEFSKEQLETLFYNVKIKEKIKKSSSKKNQAEFKLYWEDYKERVVSQNRVRNGIKFIKENYELLNKIESEFGVEKEIFTAIIGLESNYGSNLGSHRAIDAISTMAFENNPRNEFFKKQIESFIKRCKAIIQNCISVKSSWAGAIGYGQFIPTSIDAYAIDYNKNGKIDLVNEKEDAIASVANYLKKHGWKIDDFIVIKPVIEDNRYKKVLTTKLKLNTSIEELRYLNVKKLNNIRGSKEAKIFSLDSKSGEEKVFVGFKNFKAITHYNRSHLYALAVFELSQKF